MFEQRCSAVGVAACFFVVSLFVAYNNEMSASTFKAIVLGATGATGREVVIRLVNNPNCSLVTVFMRREVDVATAFPGIGKDASKVSVVVADHDKLSSYQESFAGHDVAFSCIGTSRANQEVKTVMEKDGADAGFKAWLERVDLGYTKTFAQLAANAGVKHFSRCSSRGANAQDDGPGFHIYFRYQGLADEAVSSLAEKFSHGVTCFRPGLLDRGELKKARPHEVEATKTRNGLPVGLVAEAMLAEWERRRQAEPASTSRIVTLEELCEMVGTDSSKYT